jgi:hypothetical protein
MQDFLSISQGDVKVVRRKYGTARVSLMCSPITIRENGQQVSYSNGDPLSWSQH